ncbi:MAG: histidinol-phosphate transaminase, partial [Desulfobacterales bacterium]
MKISVPDYIRSLKPYVAGKPLEELEREYGITDAIKLASNENPLGPSPLAVRAIKQAIEKLHRYPHGGCHDLCDSLSQRFDVAKENIILG